MNELTQPPDQPVAETPSPDEIGSPSVTFHEKRKFNPEFSPSFITLGEAESDFPFYPADAGQELRLPPNPHFENLFTNPAYLKEIASQEGLSQLTDDLGDDFILEAANRALVDHIFADDDESTADDTFDLRQETISRVIFGHPVTSAANFFADARAHFSEHQTLRERNPSAWEAIEAVSRHRRRPVALPADDQLVLIEPSLFSANVLGDADPTLTRSSQTEEDGDIEQVADQVWREEHPVLDFALRFINETAGTVLDTFGARPKDEPLTRAEAYENYQGSLRRLAGLNVASFNPTQAVVHDNGRGRLVPNPEGLGSLTGGLITGKGIQALSGELRGLKIKLRAKERALSAQERAEAISGATYDPESKVFIKDGQRIPDDEIPDLFRKEVTESESAYSDPEAAKKSINPENHERLIEAYDGATDTYYDRGEIIAGERIEDYLKKRQEGSEVTRIPNRNDNTISLESDGPGAMTRLVYEPASYHGSRNSGAKSAAPKNGQDALDVSLVVKETSHRRVSIDYEANEFVIFDRTREGIYHGHVRSWEELPIKAKNALIKAGMVSAKGDILR